MNKDDYVIIVDESFNIGRQSLLLILGVNLSAYTYGKSLKMEDMEVLMIEVKKSWTADAISGKIEQLKEEGYQITYACSDGGKNIVKSLKDSKIPRIYDCTHAFGLSVKNAYKDMEIFVQFTARYSLFNRQNYMGQDVCICPPKLRGKSRFLNIYPIANWAAKHLKIVRKLDKKNAKKKLNEEEERIYQKLIWLENYADLILELVHLSKLLKESFKILKKEGLSEASMKKMSQLIAMSKAPLFIRQYIRKWMIENKELLSKYEQLVCCSDIIESYFGKFKYEQTKNPNKGVTIGCLNIAAFGKKINKNKVKKAMEEVRVVDLKKWRTDRNLKSLNEKRNELLQKVG